MSTAAAAVTAPADVKDPKAAPAAAATAAAGKPKRPGMRKRTKFFLILFSLITMAVMRTGFIFLLVAMMPAIITYYIDRSPHRYTYKTIFACNLSGTLPFIAKLLHYGPGGILLQETMQNLGTWVIIYGAAMGGYILTAVAPIFAHFIISNFHVGQVSRLERSQKQIQSEWGDEVARLSVLTNDKH